MPSSLESTRSLGRYRAAVFVLSLLMALLMTFVIWHAQAVVGQTNDLYKFADLGRNIVEGNGLRFTGGAPTMRRAPLYPAFIALLYWIFGVHPVVIQVAQCFLAAGTCVLVFEIGRRCLSLRTGILAAAFTALHPMIMRYVPDIQLEAFLTFLYTLTVYRTVRLVEDETLMNGFWLGAAAAAAAMVKGVALPYPALFIVGYLLFRRASRTPGGPALPGWKPIAMMLLAMGLIILPWTYRNYGITGGKLVLISGNASGEFLRGYVFAQPRYFLLRDQPYSVGENEANAAQRELFEKQGLVWERDEAETERVQNIAVKQKLRDPEAFVRKFVIGTFAFWYVVTTRLNSLVVGACALGAWALAIFGWTQGRRQGHRFWLLFLPILSLNLLYATVLALGRYSAPCIPTLMVLAAYGVECLLVRFNKAEAAPSASATV